MKITRRILGIFVMVAGIIGLLLSLTGLVGVWLARTTVLGYANTTIMTLQKSLTTSQDVLPERRVDAFVGYLGATA